MIKEHCWEVCPPLLHERTTFAVAWLRGEIFSIGSRRGSGIGTVERLDTLSKKRTLLQQHLHSRFIQWIRHHKLPILHRFYFCRPFVDGACVDAKVLESKIVCDKLKVVFTGAWGTLLEDVPRETSEYQCVFMQKVFELLADSSDSENVSIAGVDYIAI